MTRIAMISEHASPLAVLGGKDGGGQNVYVAQLAEQLVNRGFEVDVYTRREAEMVAEVVVMPSGVRVIQIQAGPAQPIDKEKLLPFMDEFTLGMMRFITREGIEYDLMHAHFFMSAWVAYQLKRWLIVPYVVTFHALGKIRRKHQRSADQFPDERLGIEAVVGMDADAVIAECPQDVDDLTSLYALDRERIYMIPCGYDPREFEPLPKRLACEKVGLDPHLQYVLQLGRVVQRKGIETVIRGFAHLVRTVEVFDEVRLLVVGGETDEPDPRFTPELGRLMLVAEAMGVADKVIFTGRKERNKLKYYYNAAEVLVTTPWYEPFGITPLEAMGCAKPVIGARVGGIPYSVVHEETGLLVPPQNPLAVAKALYKVLSDQQMAKQWGLAGRKRVREFFTWEQVTKEMIRVYERILKREQYMAHVEPQRVGRVRAQLMAHMKGGKATRKRLNMPVKEKAAQQPFWQRWWQQVVGEGRSV
jgi:D-inositol-3-phosphate glycosyltransferase